MSDMKKPVFFFCLLALAYFGCRRLEVERLDFFEVSTKKAARLDELNAGVVVVEGGLVNTNGHPVTRCGFVWSEDLAAISKPQPDAGLPELLAVVPPTGDGDFSSTFSAPRPQTPVYFRAFAQAATEAGERKVFAPEIKPFTLGEMAAMTENEPVVVNDRVTVEGRLIGWNALIVNAKRHGFLYSAKNPDPRLGLSDCTDFPKSTLPSVDYAFTAQITGLDFNTDYYIRCYALTESDTFYSTAVKKASVTDGWKRLPNDMPSLHADGVAAVQDGKAYLGLGCRESGLCLQANLTKTYQQFDPAAQGGQGGWNMLASFGGNPAPANAVSFVIQDTVFVLFGGYQAISPDLVLFNLPLIGFWKYLPKTNQWIKPAQPPVSIYGRASAVAFVLSDKAYVGTGYYEDSNDNFKDYYLNDLWEYNSVTTKWRPVANLPAMFGGTEYPGQGRYEAAAFVLNGKAYVGGGWGDGRNLRDFWEFVPPLNNTDSGTWKFVGYFKGKSRIEATAFAIGGKGYYGMGYHFAEGSEPFAYYLDDWWEFDPNAADPWRQRTSFQGGYRSRALGFGIGASGYAGGGLVNRLDSTQTIVTEGLLPDFWKYTPAKK